MYAINCARCHPERYATEFTAAQWKTIMLHMRVRANLPAAQAKDDLEVSAGRRRKLNQPKEFIMKISSLIFGAAAAVCALGVALTPRAAAMISDEDFNALRSMVTNQDQRIGQQARDWSA